MLLFDNARRSIFGQVLLESAIRNMDGFAIKADDIENILNWEKSSKNSVEVPFRPARVLLQDFTGVPW